MAELRFTVPNIADFDPRAWDSAYITGIEGIPWHCKHSQSGDQFSIGREIDESGKVNVVFPTQSLGNVCLATTTLRVSNQSSYSLPIEIARGVVNVLRTQTDEWQRVGLRLPEEFFTLADEALDSFLQALTRERDSEEQVRSSKSAINLALRASALLCDTFGHQALEARRNNEGRLATLLGCRIEPDCSLRVMGEAIRTAFNLICIPADFGTVAGASSGTNYEVFDSQIQWASETDQKICVGPLVDFRDGQLPDWMILLDEGFDSLHSAACQHVQRTVERYKGKVHLWNCASGFERPFSARMDGRRSSPDGGFAY